MIADPFLLLWHAQTGQKEFGSAFLDVFYNLFLFFAIEVAFMASCELEGNVKFHETGCGSLGNARRASQEIYRPLFFRGNLQKFFSKVCARHPFRERRAKLFACPEHPGSVRNDQVARIQDFLKLGILLRNHDHFRIRRSNHAGLSFKNSFLCPLESVLHGDRMHADIHDNLLLFTDICHLAL